MKVRSRVTVGALAGLSLIAAACGGGSGTSETAGTVDQAVQDAIKGAETTTAGGAAATTAAPVKAPTTLAEWEALWAKEREAVVKKIKDNKWGISADGKSVTGPEGFKIDLSKCPPGWSNTEGVSDTEIKIGHTTALSGTLADYGNIAKAMDVQLAALNAAGGIKGADGKSRKLTMITKDDGYDANRTIPLVDELIDSEKVFAVITLGSPNTMKTYDKLNQRCIPQPLVMTGHPAWGDPVNHPWTTGEQLAYNTEAVFWGSFIEDKEDELTGPDGKITVAALVMNNDFGKSYDGGFKAWLAQTPLKDKINYVTETIEPQAPTITDPMTTLASKNPQLFIAMTAGTSCTQAIQEASQNGLKAAAKYVFQPSVCKSQSFVGKEKVGGDGMSSDGWWVVGGGLKDFNSPALDNDPWVKDGREKLKAAGLDYTKSGSLGAGWRWGWTTSQLFQIAAQLDGGMTRANLIVALRSIDMTAPFLLEGAKFNMNGNKDAFLTEASEYSKYDAAKQTWAQQGDLIELSGKSTNCAWDQATGVCK